MIEIFLLGHCLFYGIIVFFAAIVVLLLVYLVFEKRIDRFFGEGTGIVGLVLSVIVGFVGIFIGLKDKEEFYQTEEKTEVVEIFAAGISNGSERNIYVLRDRDYYRYYVGDSIQGFELRKIPADISTVKYTKGKPHIKVMYDQYVKFPELYNNMRYELYIPHGSVVSDYTIKL